MHPERLQQHRQHQWQGESDGHDQGQTLAVQALLLVISRWVVGFPNAGGVTGLGHGGDQDLRVDLAEQFEMGAFVGQIDADALHPRHFVQRTFDAADAGSTGHAVNAQFQTVLRHAVTGFFHRIHQRWQAA
ncbi:hypothetical protein D3C78_1517230 [compost metagenome]